MGPAVDLDCKFDVFRFGGIMFFGWEDTEKGRIKKEFVQAVTKIISRDDPSDSKYYLLSMEGKLWKEGAYEDLTAECSVDKEGLEKITRWIYVINERAMQQGETPVV